MEPNKCDDLKWFDINNLPENIIPFVKFVLKEIFNKQNNYYEYGWKDKK